MGSDVCHSRQVLEYPTRRQQVLVSGWGALLALGICLPLLGSGALWLLDWVSGPHTPLVPPDALGLAGGLVSGVPFTIVANWLVRNLAGTGTWIPLVAVYPLAAWGGSRLVGGSNRARAAAATFYCVNPFVFQRIYAGHLGLLLGYALLPFAVASALPLHEVGQLAPAHPRPVVGRADCSEPPFRLDLRHRSGRSMADISTGVPHHAGTARCGLGPTSSLLLSVYVLLPTTQTQLPINTRTASDSRLTQPLATLTSVSSSMCSACTGSGDSAQARSCRKTS